MSWFNAWERFIDALGHITETSLTLAFAIDQQEVQRAQELFEHNTGKAFPDEPIYERRQQLFYEWFVFLRPLIKTGKPPLQLLLAQENLTRLPADVVSKLNDFFMGFQGAEQMVGQVKRKSDQLVLLEDITTKKLYDVHVGSTVGIEKKALMFVQLFNLDGYFYASTSAEMIDQGSSKRLRRELEQLHHVNQTSENLWEAGLRFALVVERYPHAKMDEWVARWQQMIRNHSEGNTYAKTS